MFQQLLLPAWALPVLGSAFLLFACLFLLVLRISTGAVSRRAQVLAFIGIANLAFNLGRTRTVGLGSGFEPLEIARSLVAGNGFANPFSTGPTGTTAHCAPLFPALLALELLIFGDSKAFAIGALAVAIVIQFVTIACLPFIAQRLFGDERPGFIAAVLLIPFNPLRPELDSGITAALCALTVLMIVSVKPVLSGLLSGLTGLTNPAPLPGIAWCMLARFSRKQLLVAGALTLAICASWIVRTRIVLGAWVPIRDNFGLELWVYNSERPDPYRDYAHPDTSSDAVAKMRQLGEIEYDRQMLRNALDWIQRYPGVFARLTLGRIADFWFADALHSALTCLCFAGLFFSPKPAILSLAGLFILYPLPYYLTVAATRYTPAIGWAMALFAGQFLLMLWQKKFAAKPAP